MSTRPISALTFDLWDTLVVDDSDEAIRKSRGLPSKDSAKRTAFAELARSHRPELADSAIQAAYDAGWQQFRVWWKQEHHTPVMAEWLAVGLSKLEIDDPEGTAKLGATLGRLEVDIPPRPIDGVHAVLDALHGRVPLAIVSDTINTPASGLRDILRQHKLLHYFDHCAFSDEVGASKPAAAGFEAVAHALQVPLDGIVHVGDRQETDVDGIQRVGGRAVLLTAAVDRHGTDHSAEVVCAHYSQFLGLLDRLGDLA